MLRGDRSQALSLDEIRKLAGVGLHSLRQKLSDTDRAAEELANLRAMLESIPQETGEFSLAMNRLRNAQRFLCSDETGAARYELRLLVGGL
jgi:hypothetical protein